ncbi:MAG: type II secretion system F family protein [Vicinamibacteraceae bacterium]
MLTDRMEFQCRLGTEHGQIVEGVYVADDEVGLRRDLEGKGYLILAARAKGSLALPGLPALPTFRRRRVTGQELLLFNQELATLLKAGLPLAQSLDILRQKVPNPTFKSVLDDIYEKVRSGIALSDACGAHGSLFPPIYTASLLAGEKSGNLDEMLRRFIAYTRVVDAVKRNALSAMIYPAVLFSLSLLVLSGIMVWVVPAFQDFYGSFRAELPLATRILIGVSNVIRSNLPYLILAGVGGGVFVWQWLRSRANVVRLHAVMLRVPGLGAVATQFATSQFARTLSTLLGGGIPLVAALEVAGRAVGNRHIGAAVETVTRQVREGVSLGKAMAERRVFPDVALKMVDVGEQTGALQEMLNAVADFYDESVETTLSRFTKLIEPLMLVIMAVVIALILLALYMPVFQLSSAVS